MFHSAITPHSSGFSFWETTQNTESLGAPCWAGFLCGFNEFERVAVHNSALSVLIDRIADMPKPGLEVLG
jgi:hypothetical protein